MRAVTVEEIDQISGGLKKVYAKNGLRPQDTWAPCNPTCPGSPPVVGTPSGPPDSGYPPITMPGSGGGGGGGDPGGGGGGSPGYNDGTHDVYERNYTGNALDHGNHNPGDIKYGSFAESHGGTDGYNHFAQFQSEQDGRDAFAALLDGSYGNDTISNFESHGYTSTNPQQAADGVEGYMQRSGYGPSDWQQPISQMSNTEFNVFLDAVTYEEGHTNMGGQNSG